VKVRLVSAAVLAGALALSTVGAQAAPKTLDGKKTKVLTFKVAGGLQTHDSDMVTDSASLEARDRADCTAPRCAKLPFVYKPAKGVKGNVAFQISWTNAASDFDLYVAIVNKDGSTSDIGHCGGTTGTAEKLYLDAGNFKAGKSYALVVDFYRSVNDTVTGTVTMPGTDQVKKTLPDPGGFGITDSANCSL
jgi:hypothetical protein